MPTDSLTDDDYASLSEFRYQLRRFHSFSDEQARAAGLNPQQHQLLLAVRGHGEDAPTVGALSERLMLRHHSTVELIDRLERSALVRRRRSKQDGRVVTISITALGARVLRRLSLAHRDELRRTAPALIRALSALQSKRPRAARQRSA